MSIVKEEQYELEVKILQQARDGGTAPVRAWLYIAQAKVNSMWPGAIGEELYRLQGEARLITRLLKVIDNGPAYRKPDGGTNG